MVFVAINLNDICMGDVNGNYQEVKESILGPTTRARARMIKNVMKA